MARDALRDGVPVVRAIQKTENAVAQMLISAVEDDLPVIAGAIEAVHRRVDCADVELPAALEEVGDLVEQQPGVPAIHFHPLTAEAAPLADRSDRGADGSHQRDCDVVRFHDQIDIAGRLLDLNRVGRGLRQSKPSRDRREDFFLSFGIHGLAPQLTPRQKRCDAIGCPTVAPLRRTRRSYGHRGLISRMTTKRHGCKQRQPG